MSRRSQAPVTNRVPAARVFVLLGFTSEQAFNHSRRRLQRVLNETLHREDPYPDFASSHFADEKVELLNREAQLRGLDRHGDPERTAVVRTELRQLRAELTAKVRAIEVEFERDHTLVVPRWGGVKYPAASWTYDLALCTALSEGGSVALLQAKARTAGRG